LVDSRGRARSADAHLDETAGEGIGVILDVFDHDRAHRR
jgi:hypothetical protein